MKFCRNLNHTCIQYSPKFHRNLQEGLRERATQRPAKRGNVPAVWAGQSTLRRYLQLAVSRQPGYRQNLVEQAFRIEIIFFENHAKIQLLFRDLAFHQVYGMQHRFACRKRRIMSTIFQSFMKQ